MAEPAAGWRPFLTSLAKDWGLALGAAVVAWLVWTKFLAPAPLSTGPAPDFTLPDAANGSPITLSALGKGKIVLNFWFTSCGPCRAEIPELARFHKGHPEVPLYGVSVDRTSPVRLMALAGQLGVNYPVLLDAASEVAERYGVSLFPTTVVIEDGNIARVHLGGIDRAGLEKLVAD
jgi:cytochrome c biogenesis protein CcmG/thiol:disulfide interchange protein DsbE